MPWDFSSLTMYWQQQCELICYYTPITLLNLKHRDQIQNLQSMLEQSSISEYAKLEVRQLFGNARYVQHQVTRQDFSIIMKYQDVLGRDNVFNR